MSVARHRPPRVNQGLLGSREHDSSFGILHGAFLPQTGTIPPNHPATAAAPQPPQLPLARRYEDRPRVKLVAKPQRKQQVRSKAKRSSTSRDLTSMSVASSISSSLIHAFVATPSTVSEAGSETSTDADMQPVPRPRVEARRPLSVLEFELGEALGFGGSATVLRADVRPDSRAATVLPTEEVALKIVERDVLNNRAFHFLKREIAIHRRVGDHTNIVTLYDVFTDSSCIYLAMELLSGKSLYDYLRAEGRGLSERMALEVIRQLLEGLSYMHQRGYAHRDIKPENIMFASPLGPGDLPDVRLIDFGLSWARDPRDRNGKSSERAGTVRYAAPEIITERAYVPELCDIWSLGIVFYSIIAHRNPYSGATEREVLRNIRDNPLNFDSNAFDQVSSNTKHLIRRCLSVNPSERPDAAGCLVEVERILERLRVIPGESVDGEDITSGLTGFASHVTPERGSPNRQGAPGRNSPGNSGDGHGGNLLDGIIRAIFSGGSAADDNDRAR